MLDNSSTHKTPQIKTQVEDLAENERRIEAAGGEQVVEPAEIPGVGTVAYFRDTEGNIFGALQPA